MTTRVDEGAEKGARRELTGVGDPHVGFQYGSKRLCDGPFVGNVRCPNISVHQGMASVVFSDAVLMHVPGREGRTGTITVDAERRSGLDIGTFPKLAEEGLGVRKDKHLPDALK